MTNSSAFYNRLIKNLNRLKSWRIQGKIEAFRLYDKDIPEYPYIVDIYKDMVVVFEQGKRLDETAEHLELVENHQLDIFEALVKIGYQENNILLKRRVRQSGTNQYERFSNEAGFFPVQEYQAKLWVNLTDYLDTGLFLDHRPMRQTIFKQAKGKSFLNLFAYTGSVSVFAALGGAHCTTIDMSNTYLNWALENFKINNIDPDQHKFIREDVLKYIEVCRDQFDLIFLDPPTFSNSKKMEESFEVNRDQVELVTATMKLLKKDGLLYFSTNYRDFKIDPDLQTYFKIKDITPQTIPIDFRSPKIHHVYEVRHL